jgi:hypothetical protein
VSSSPNADTDDVELSVVMLTTLSNDGMPVVFCCGLPSVDVSVELKDDARLSEEVVGDVVGMFESGFS